MMEMLFGRAKTPTEMANQHRRTLERAKGSLSSERQKLERQEKKLIMDIKKAAKANQINACKIMAQDLVRTRRYASKFQAMEAQLGALALRIRSLQSNQQMAETMKGVTKAMKSMNRQMNLPQIQRIMMEFERESEVMDMKEDMMNDVIDDVMEEEDDEKASDEIINMVFDEIGISLKQSLVDTPNVIEKASASERVPQVTELEANDAALQARLDNLRRE